MLVRALLALLLALPSAAAQKGVRAPAAPKAAAPALPVLPAAAVKPGAAPIAQAKGAPVSAQAQAAGVVQALGAGAAAPQAALGAAFDNAAGAGDAAASAVAEPPSGRVRELSAIETLKIGTYNVLNLFQKVGKHERRADGGLAPVQGQGPVAKEAAMRRAQAQAILEEDLDVVVLQEVENIQALRDFTRDHLGGAYHPLLIEGNDERGIDVAFLVKKDLPFWLEHRTRKTETWHDPVLGREAELFSRDLTSIVIRADGRDKPLAVLFGTHMKSKRHRPGDDNSEIWRRAQAKRTAEILEEERALFGPDVPLLIAGDFNGDLARDPALRPIFDAGFVDSLAAAGVPESERITHTYHPFGGKTQMHQMDGVVVDARWAKLIKGSHVYRYKYPDGKVKPIPDTYKKRSKNPSDHFPVILHLDFRLLLQSQR